MFEPTEHEVDDDLRKSIQMFQRSKVGEVPAIEPLRPKKLLLALDGSSQDETSIELARQLCQRFEPSLDVVDAREQIGENSLAEKTAAVLDARALAKPAGESFDQILGAIASSECDLAIVPCPFGRDLETVGTDSTGTVIDVLLARSPVPLLIVRQPYPQEETPFEKVIMLLIGENEAASLAAQWAAGLVAPAGSVGLLLVLEEEVIENVQALFRSLDANTEVTPDMLSDAMEQSYLVLHRGLQKAAEKHGFQSVFAVRREADGPLAELQGQHPLLVLALERRDHGSQGHVHDRIRHSPHPLLVVARD